MSLMKVKFCVLSVQRMFPEAENMLRVTIQAICVAILKLSILTSFHNYKPNRRKKKNEVRVVAQVSVGVVTSQQS